MASVTLNQVAKRYGKVSVIEGLDLEIRDAEFMVLVGPSGCGKSTLLRMTAGLEELSGGTIAVGERVVNDVPPKDRDIAMVFQNYALYPHMSVRENLEFGLRMRGTSSTETARRVNEAAGILDIGHLLERKPKDLSGGQRQRVAVGRAIVRKPSVFLFDEPLSNLDAKLRAQTRAEITKLQHTLGTTAIYVTHDQIEAMTMGDRITLLRDGKVQQVGTPREVYERPANVFVAQFIGTPPMNLVPATVSGSSFDTASFSLPIAAEISSRVSDGQKVLLGIRPEQLEPAGKAESRHSLIQVKIDVVEPIGHESIVHAIAGDTRIVAIFEPHATPRVDEMTVMALDPAAIHVFDAATELSVR